MRLSLLVLLLSACGGSTPATRPDLTVEVAADMTASPDDLPDLALGALCVTKDQCGPVEVCAYPLADGCAATGRCAPAPTSGCGAIEELCGCDGKIVQGGTCSYPAGYAGGPTTGKSAGNCDSDAGS